MFIDRIIPFVIQLDILCLRLLNLAGFDFENIFIVIYIIIYIWVSCGIKSSKSLSSRIFFFMLMMSKGDSLGIAT